MTLVLSDHLCRFYTIIHILVPCFFFFFKQKTAYEIGLGIPAEPLFRSHDGGYYTVNSHTVLDGIITTIMATIQRINIIGSRERSEERRVGKEYRSPWGEYHKKKTEQITRTMRARGYKP